MEASRFNQRFQQFGATPQGMRTFGVLERGIFGVNWYGRQISDATLLYFHPTSGFEAVSQKEFDCYTLSFSEAQLAEVSERLGLPDAHTFLGQNETAHTFGNELVADTRNRLRHIFDAVRSNPAIAEDPGLRNEMEQEIPSQLLSALSSITNEVPRPSIRSRRRTLEKAINLVNEQAAIPLTIAELCGAVGVSWRTLDYAFKEHFGISPKRYLMAVRLNAVRKELSSMPSRVTVASVASRWGFWHMSQFAKEYKKFFGELPSETLHKKGTAQVSL